MKRLIVLVFISLCMFACNKESEEFILDAPNLDLEESIVTKSTNYGTPWEPTNPPSYNWNPSNPVGYPPKGNDQYPGWGTYGVNWPSPGFQLETHMGMGENSRTVALYLSRLEDTRHLYNWGQLFHLMYRKKGGGTWYYYHPNKIYSQEMNTITVGPYHPDLTSLSHRIDPNMLPSGDLEVKVRYIAHSANSSNRADASLWRVSSYHNYWGFKDEPIDPNDPRLVSLTIRVDVSVTINAISNGYYYRITGSAGAGSPSFGTKGTYHISFSKEVRVLPDYPVYMDYTVSVAQTDNRGMATYRTDSKTFTSTVRFSPEEVSSDKKVMKYISQGTTFHFI